MDDINIINIFCLLVGAFGGIWGIIKENKKDGIFHNEEIVKLKVNVEYIQNDVKRILEKINEKDENFEKLKQRVADLEYKMDDHKAQLKRVWENKEFNRRKNRDDEVINIEK